MSLPSLLCAATLLLIVASNVTAISPGDENEATSPLGDPSSSTGIEPSSSPAESPDASSDESPAPDAGSPTNDDSDYSEFEGSPVSSPPSPPPPPYEEWSETPDESSGSLSLIWCAVREEIKVCRNFVSMLNVNSNYSWSCEAKDNTFECMQAIQKGDADVMSLDTGTAYVAFMNYKMKAIMMEEYCYFERSYDAVAVVHKEMCDKNPHLSLKNFQGMKSCHSGYLTAAGWNYPVQFLVDSGLQKPPKRLVDEKQGKDEAVVASFFSSTCAPSELEGKGLCSSCGNNGTCATESFAYAGYAGAFKCLVDGIGDIAFMRSGIVERLSVDGKHAQEWSTKSVDDFRYLCPQGGCRTINENIGNCTEGLLVTSSLQTFFSAGRVHYPKFCISCRFGSIPANVLMTRNSQPNKRRLEIVRRLLNASYSGALYNPENWNDYVLSSSAQGLVEVSELTRQALGISAVVAQTVQTLGENRTVVTSLYPSGSSILAYPWYSALLLTLLSVGLASHLK